MIVRELLDAFERCKSATHLPDNIDFLDMIVTITNEAGEIIATDPLHQDIKIEFDHPADHALRPVAEGSE